MGVWLWSPSLSASPSVPPLVVAHAPQVAFTGAVQVPQAVLFVAVLPPEPLPLVVGQAPHDALRGALQTPHVVVLVGVWVLGV